jgi:hypothetical protein
MCRAFAFPRVPPASELASATRPRRQRSAQREGRTSDRRSLEQTVRRPPRRPDPPCIGPLEAFAALRRRLRAAPRAVASWTACRAAESMEIVDFKQRMNGDRTTVSAVVGGLPLEFTVPAGRLHAQAIGDAFLLNAIVPSMRRGTTIRLPRDVPVSARLLGEIPGIQRMFRSWNARLAPVDVDAIACQPGPGRDTGLFYAGGVDSSYSLLAHRDEVDALIAIFGFDMAMSEEDRAASHARHARFASDLGKEFIQVDSNVRTFVTQHGVRRSFVFGAILSSVALLLGLQRCYIASSHTTIAKKPDGSHPSLDKRFSNGTTTIVHDDDSVPRVEKTRAVAADPRFLANLVVCWDQPNANCGRCMKCVRTMTALRVLKAPPGPFPPLDDLQSVYAMARQADFDFLVELILAAHEAGDVDVLRELKRGQRRQDLLDAARHLIWGMTGRRIPRALRRHRNAQDVVKNDLRPDLDCG